MFVFIIYKVYLKINLKSMGCGKLCLALRKFTEGGFQEIYGYFIQNPLEFDLTTSFV